MSVHNNSHFWLNFFILISQIISPSEQSDIHSYLAYLSSAQTKVHALLQQLVK